MVAWLADKRAPVTMKNHDGTLGSLIALYRSDLDSKYHNLRHHTQLSYDSKLDTLLAARGAAVLAEMTFRDFLRLHERARGPDDRIARAHSLITMVRIVIGFGVMTEVPECARLNEVLKKMKFELPKKRTTFLTATDVIAIRIEAHRQGFPSIALAQALQFETMLRQKDVIGEWVPLSEPGVSDITDSTSKWLHGARWSDVSADLVLRKRISKSLRGRRAVAQDAGKVLEFDLRAMPMVMEELEFWRGCSGVERYGAALNLKAPRNAHGDQRPAVQCGPDQTDPSGLPDDLTRLIRARTGPLILCEFSGQPWRAKGFQRRWRLIATAAGIPFEVQNRDSRAGGITEATDAGADFELVRRQAGHSQQSMTARYSRSHLDNTVALRRVESRKK